MKVVGIIPSRLKSTRVPNKPLVDICGLPMVVHVYKRACFSDVLDDVIVATDSNEVKSVVEKHGGKAVITSVDHKNGTERLAEVAKYIDADIIVLINGDEAILDPDHIQDSLDALLKSNSDASILVIDFFKENSPSDFKVVLNSKDEVMYISRSDIPSNARNPVQSMLKAYHILSFKRQFLIEYAKMDKSLLEKIEDHEHLRIIENGYTLKAKKVSGHSISVDTNQDLMYVREVMKTDPYFLKYKIKH
jgi:3-deoxy-manno-octulosonate cytidylyltransferase (CMP-KDO synthetase)